MTLVRSFFVAGVLLVGVARAQSSQPEDEWGKLPNAKPDAPPPPPAVGIPPPPPAPAPFVAPLPSPGPTALTPLRPRSEVLARVRPPEPRNNVSMLGGSSLGHLNRGEMVLLGFPLLQLRFLIGLGDRFDLGVGFDSYYFMMNEPRLVARFNVVKTETFALGLTLEGGYAFFSKRAAREQQEGRWLTGRRNINISPAIVASYQGTSHRAVRLFIEGRYLVALDTEPFATDPLVGVPPTIIVGHNVTFRGGAEMPITDKTSFVILFGFDIHGRANDAVVMPNASLGLVTSL